MTNFIITGIAIVLVALASLMGAHYGGHSFLRSSPATSLINQAAEIHTAWNQFLEDNAGSAPRFQTSDDVMTSLVDGQTTALENFSTDLTENITGNTLDFQISRDGNIYYMTLDVGTADDSVCSEVGRLAGQEDQRNGKTINRAELAKSIASFPYGCTKVKSVLSSSSIAAESTLESNQMAASEARDGDTTADSPQSLFWYRLQ